MGLNARVNKNFANASDNTGVPVIRSKYGTVFKIGGGTGSYQSTANGYVDEDGNPVTLSDSPGFRENLLRLAYGSTNNGGDLYVGKTVTSGADYAEIYEWEDTNSNGEDRRGLFVTLNGTKIKKAKGTDEYVLGIISSDPAVIGDCPDGWHNMYLKDVFGKILYYDDVDEEGNVTSKPLINPDYDPSQHYISRDQRIEKDAVGTHGKLVVVDDGTCVVNGYCWPGTNGIGTNDTVHKAYRVMERLDDTHVRVVLK